MDGQNLGLHMILKDIANSYVYIYVYMYVSKDKLFLYWI